MDITKIKAIHEKAKAEAEAAIEAIYEKYNQELVDAVAELIPVGFQLGSVNGCNRLMKDGEFVTEDGDVCESKSDEVGSSLSYFKVANGLVDLEEGFGYLATLQYSDEFNGAFSIPMYIDGTKKVTK